MCQYIKKFLKENYQNFHLCIIYVNSQTPGLWVRFLKKELDMMSFTGNE